MANGSETGVIVYMGDTATCVVPVLGVRVIHKAINRLSLGYNDLFEENNVDSVYLVSAHVACVCVVGL